MLEHWCGHVVTNENAKEFRYTQAIYALVDVRTELGYVGHTKSVFHRRRIHLSHLRTGHHHNRRIRELLEEDPQREFVFLILAMCKGRGGIFDELCAQEVAWPRNVACNTMSQPRPRGPPEPRDFRIY